MDDDTDDLYIPYSLHREMLSVQLNGTELAYLLEMWHSTWFMR